MKTAHKIYIKNSSKMTELHNESIDLVITSPPYPMIKMWDEMFFESNPNIQQALNDEDGNLAFELMNKELDRTWEELYRVLKSGGIVCINIGDATRKVGKKFQIYMNSVRVVTAMKKLGFDVLPPIIWKKTTNSPNKFMGSGMLPAGAYVTLENEHILIFRKGNKREFKSPQNKMLRRKSAFFWEERNQWFTNLWTLKGAKQNTYNGEKRIRSGAFIKELPLRLISMYSLQGDTVLDPFAGTGTTNIAAALLARNSFGYEIDRSMLNNFETEMLRLINMSYDYNSKRMIEHEAFLKSYKKDPKYYNSNLGTHVITSQEKDIRFLYVENISKINDLVYNVTYNDKKLHH